MTVTGLKRVVITGLGPVTPIGIGAQAFVEAQRAGKSGIAPITQFDAKDTASKIAGEVKGSLDAWVDPKEARKLDRVVQLALAGAELAVQDSGLTEEDIRAERERVGTLVGSGIGGMKTFEDQAKVYVERGAGRISPMFIPMQIANMASGHVAMRYGAMGPSSTVVTACATGTGAIGEAARYAAQRKQFGQPIASFGAIKHKIGEMVVRAYAVEAPAELAYVSSNMIEIDWPPRSGRRLEIPEVDRAEWMSPAAARSRLIPGQRGLLDRLLTHLGRG